MAHAEQFSSSDEYQETIANTNSRPIASFSGSGGLNVAVWKNKSEKGIENYSVRIDRNYKLDNGTFQSTPYLRDGDLLRAATLIEQADAWIEQDKAKSRGVAANRSSAER